MSLGKSTGARVKLGIHFSERTIARLKLGRKQLQKRQDSALIKAQPAWEEEQKNRGGTFLIM